MESFGGRIPRKNQEGTKEKYDNCVHLEADQSVCSMKLPLYACRAGTSAAVGAWVLLELNYKEQTGGHSRRGRAECQPGASEAGREISAVSIRGGALTPNVRNVDLVN